MSNQKGFTLIEIIAVLVILGILAAVAIPRFMDLTSVASEKAAMRESPRGNPGCQSVRKKSSNGRYVSKTAQRILPFKGNASLSDAGDYRLTYLAATMEELRITASGVGSVKGTTTGGWVRPQ